MCSTFVDKCIRTMAEQVERGALAGEVSTIMLSDPGFFRCLSRGIVNAQK